MILSAAVLVLLAAAAAAVRAVSRWLARPVPFGILALLALLSLVPLAGGLRPGRTILPLEHVRLTAPWVTLGTGPPRNPWLNDVAMQMLPWNEAVRLAFAEGALPLRNRWNGAGMPLAANAQSAAFSPFTLLTLFLPIPAAFLLGACVKLLLALAGMWLWTRELSASRGAAVFAAIAFAFSMTFSQWILFPHTAVFCFWPWLLFVLERSRDPAGRTRTVAATVLVLAFAALAGHPESLALGVLFAALWILVRWAVRDLDLRQAAVVTRSLLLGGLAAAGLTAFLLLPTIFAIRASNRMVLAALPHWNAAFSLTPHGGLWRAASTAFFPRSLGDLIHMPPLAGVTGAFPEMALGYFGIVGWAAALLLFRPGSARLRASWALLALILCGLGVAIALWPFAEIFGAIPAVRQVFPLRFYSWIALAGSALAALELDRYAKDRAQGRRPVVAAVVSPLLLAGAGLVWFLHLRPELTAEGALAFQKRQLGIAAGLLFSAAALALLTGPRTGIYVAGMAALCAGDLLYQWRSHYRPFSPALLFPETPLVRHLREPPGHFRVAGTATALFPNTNVFAGVEDIRTHDPLERRDYVAFLDATAGFPPGEYFKKLGNVGSPALDFLNVRWLVVQAGASPPGGRWRKAYSGPDGDVYENPAVLPRAFVPERVRFVPGGSAVEKAEPLADANAAFGAAFAEIAANPDFRATAWILGESDGEASGGAASITNYRETTNAIGFDVAVASGSAWIVLSVIQDGGWSAEDGDGRDLALSRANGPFLAVRLPAGNTGVHLRYCPPGFRAGAWISAATLSTLAILAALAFRRGRAVRPA